MADADNATRAPESDAQETSAAVVGEHCVTDRPTPSGQASTGEIIKLNDVDVYISKPTDYPHAPSRLLLLLTGGTGIKSTNNQIQADKFASEGYLVLMPDLFAGDTAPGATAVTDDSTSILEQFKLKAVEVTKSFLIDMWLARVTEDRVMPILHKVIDAAREQYADSIQRGDGIYAAGYCVGARFVLLLAKKTKVVEGDAESGGLKSGPFIKAGALAHAASVTPDDFKDISAPLSLVCVENDPLFTDEVRIAGEDTMSDANLEHEVQVYPGVPHGFAVVGEYQDAAIKDAQATAYEQMLKWIQSH
ncbi:DLH domain-containing protein [Fusarium keratoplasticum]|uniref:DLH domain-containing protein n=1 Tax=Fusarium keratoplasticum TaxID=1328300 RepID=A0ACC0QYJ7_9HYPO|nr:DLH domain-containing protein [Fusarium keratoplasticum]KAI8669333.1 DLH domain-containing protein [Fusarium keratoplasticum]KAI8673936.1 DLH domain-containing protein [Fusarium keratoplasticum]